MSKMDIDKLSKDELIELNREIVARIKMLQNLENSKKTKLFRVDDDVKFESRKTGKCIYGTVQKVNRKTIDIKEKNSRTVWRVSASLVEDAE